MRHTPCSAAVDFSVQLPIRRVDNVAKARDKPAAVRGQTTAARAIYHGGRVVNASRNFRKNDERSAKCLGVDSDDHSGGW